MKIWILLIALLILSSLHGQSTHDDILIRIDSAWRYAEYLNRPERALEINEEILLYAKNTALIWPLIDAYQIKAEIFRSGNNRDSATFYNNKVEELLELEKDQKELVVLRRRQGRYYAKLARYEDAIENFNKSFLIATALGDTSEIITTLNNRSRLNSDADRLLMAMEDNLMLLEIHEALDDTLWTAYTLMEIGIIHKKQGHIDQAKKSYNDAISLFDQMNEKYGRSITMINLGLIYKEEGNYNQSHNVFADLTNYFEQQNNEFGLMACFANMGICSNFLGLHTRAIRELETGLKYAENLNVKEVKADIFNEIGIAHMGIGDLRQAEIWSLKSKNLASETFSIEKKRDAEKTLSTIYSKMGQFEKALDHYKSYTALKDSIYEERKAHQILDLQTKYETEKKQKQIQQLAESERNQRFQKNMFSGAFILTILVAVFIFWRESSRRKKVRKLFIAEQQVNQLQRERHQAELQFKQRELTTQALHIAQKQELIQKMKKDIEVISQSEDFSQVLRPLVNKMSSDEHLDKQWDQFMQNFRETNPAFIDSLISRYPDLSKAELRMCTLIKMNIDNKDAAGILNISDEGVKKARYRLRKKLGLDGEEKLEAVILQI